MTNVDKLSEVKKYEYVPDVGLLYTKYKIQPHGAYDLGYTPVRVLGIFNDPGSNAIVLEALDGRLMGTGEQILIYAENREQLEEHGFKELTREAMTAYFKDYKLKHNLDDQLQPIHEHEDGIDYTDEMKER